MSISEDDLWDLPDEELEAAFKEASAQANSPETDIEEEPVDNSSTDSEEEENFDDPESSDEPTGDEVENGSDQPEDLLEESDHDASEEADADSADEDDTEKPEEENPDGDAEADDAESSDKAKDAKDKSQPARSYSFRANGKDYEFSSDEIVDQFPKIFGKAMDYTKKMQTIKPWRKTIDAIEEAKISHDDVSLMIDVLKGDKEAITEVLKRTGTDTLELDTEKDSNYVAKDYGRDESALAISDVVDEINKDPEYATTYSILNNEWDDRSWETMSKNPEMIKHLHTDVKSGMYKTLQPVAEKLKVYGGGAKSDLDYYKEAAQQHFTKVAEQRAFASQQASEAQKTADTQELSDKKKARVAAAKAQSDKRAATQKASAKRKAAAPSKSASADRVVDYLDESDENFDEWYKNLQDSM